MTTAEAIARKLKLSVINVASLEENGSGVQSIVADPSVPELSAASGLKRTLLRGLAVVVVLALAAGGYTWSRFLAMHEQTDDAYTTGHLHQVSSRISGTIEKVLVDDNQHVTAGQVIAEIDPRDYEVKVRQARAALETAKHQAESARTEVVWSDTNADGKSTEAEGNIVNAKATIAKAESAVIEANDAILQAKSQLAQKQAELTRAEADYHRYNELAKQGAVSYQQRDLAVRDYEVAKEATKAGQQAIDQAHSRWLQAQQVVHSARAQLIQSQGLLRQAQATHVQTRVNTSQYEVAKAAVMQAEAQLAEAELQLSYTKIVAAADGRVGKKNLEAGQRVQPGQQLMSLVADDTWVVANFKETQLEKMRAGQKVEIKVDRFPHHVFTGTVDSFSPGSGSTFALLPADNATGNFTKIVQRVPVKIHFDKGSIGHYQNVIVPGMSVVATVSVQ